ncbi:MAG: transposase [Actinomycetota bacterium]|nr:transposase [Actinomycetota bacterium]
MILSEARLREVPAAFRAMTGLSSEEFAALARDVVPAIATAVAADRERRRGRPARRAAGGGHPFALSFREQLLLVAVRLRAYPTSPVLGFLFGVGHQTVLRTIALALPILEQAGRDTLRLPGHGERGHRSRRGLPELLRAIPELAVIVDTFEQRVQRPRARAEADRHSSGKQKQHTLKAQVATDPRTGKVVDVPDSVCGPTHDLALLKASGLLDRLAPDVGALGDLASVGIAPLHPAGLGSTPRRKPRGQPRPPEDVAYTTAFAAERIVVEHTIGRLRRYQALTQPDRHHRRHHAARVRAVAGLVNRQLDHRFGALT